MLISSIRGGEKAKMGDAKKGGDVGIVLRGGEVVSSGSRRNRYIQHT